MAPTRGHRRSGFVGGALCRRIARAQIPVLAIKRQQIDLLADGAEKQLRAILQPGDAVVAAAARATALSTCLSRM
jgi:dTDP-4-dehydrorhamnose reductase